MTYSISYGEICRMIGDVSIKSETFDSYVLVAAMRKGYTTDQKKSIKYPNIFGNAKNTVIEELAERRGELIHEIITLVDMDERSTNLIDKSWLIKEGSSDNTVDIEKKYSDFIRFYSESCLPLLQELYADWIDFTSNEVTE